MEGTLQEGWDAIAAHEQTLLAPLLAYLRGKAARGVRIVGAEDAGLARVPTVGFVVVGERAIRSSDVVQAFDNKGNVRLPSSLTSSVRLLIVRGRSGSGTGISTRTRL